LLVEHTVVADHHLVATVTGQYLRNRRTYRIAETGVRRIAL
jgi:hypothetical protein